MKKLLSMLVMALIAIAASAEVDEGFRNGIRVKGGLSNVEYDGNKVGFGYGIDWVAECNFTEHFFLQTGIGFNDISYNSDNFDNRIHVYYAQIPVHLGGRFELNDNYTSYFFIHGGPALGVGIYGTDIKTSYTDPSYNYHYHISTNYFDVAERIDVGIGIHLGFEFSGFQVGVSTDYGILKVYKHDIGGHNLSINLGLAYMF